jgi:PAS domain S-box-containing protein
MQRTTRYGAGGRTWELRFTPDLDISPARHAWPSWFVLAAGLLFTGLLEAFLLVVTGRTDAIEELVARRTAELRELNADLRHQVAERARAEAQHASSELRLAAAQQIAHLGSWELDLASRVVLCSAELHRIHGFESGETRIELERFLDRIHAEDREIVAAAIDQAVRDRKPFTHHHRIVRPDEEVRTIHVHGEVILDNGGEPIRIQGTGQDVTELKRAERELARRTLDLERSNAELERFAYVASHDLQEPLRAVASHVQILEQDYQGRLDAEADESIRCAVEGAQRMHDLINDYLAYSRIRTGSEPLLPTASGKALEIALNNLDRSIREASASVACDEMPRVLADSSQMVQLFQNLVGNAVKFRGDDPPRIRVSAVREEGAWRFSVSDNGIGIDPEHSSRIFSMFQRLHTQDRYPGTGIGLAICKKIVDRHGGRIWVESQPGLGATFHFTLSPCPDEPEPSVGAQAFHEAASDSPGSAG